jgi:hypothetical protein
MKDNRFNLIKKNLMKESEKTTKKGMKEEREDRARPLVAGFPPWWPVFNASS